MCAVIFYGIFFFRFKFFLRAEAFISITRFDEFLGVFRVDVESFGLLIRAVGAADIRAFVPVEPEGFQAVINIIDIRLTRAVEVGIFYS